MTSREEPPNEERLDAGLEQVRRSPEDDGSLERIVRRPGDGEPEVLDTAGIDVAGGLIADESGADGASGANGRDGEETRITLMNSRAASLLAGDPERWPLVGDHLFVDLDLAAENLPAGTQLRCGTAILEVTGDSGESGDFAAPFGPDAAKLVNSEEGRRLNLQGVHARIVKSGRVRTGGTIWKKR